MECIVSTLLLRLKLVVGGERPRAGDTEYVGLFADVWWEGGVRRGEFDDALGCCIEDALAG